jgi:hypothetical protein
MTKYYRHDIFIKELLLAKKMVEPIRCYSAQVCEVLLDSYTVFAKANVIVAFFLPYIGQKKTVKTKHISTLTGIIVLYSRVRKEERKEEI